MKSRGQSATNDLPVTCSQVDQRNLLAMDRILWAFAVKFNTLHTSCIYCLAIHCMWAALFDS